MSSLLCSSRWQLIHINSRALLLPYISNRGPGRRTLVPGAAVLPLVVPVLLLRVVGWRGIKALIQIRVELLVALKSTLRVISLK